MPRNSQMTFRRTLACTLLTLCAGTGVAAEKTLDIGLSDSLTGPGAVYGLAQANAVKMAVEEINGSGGIKAGADTYKLNVIAYDDKTNPTEGTNAVRKLIDRDNVKYIVGFCCSGPTSAVASFIAKEPVVMLVGNAAEEAETLCAFFRAAARRYRMPASSGAVLCQSKRAGENLATRLSDQGLPAVFQSGKQIDITAQQVKVITIHSAKGLEFPFVAVVGLDAGRFPRAVEGYPDEEIAAMEDEQRRLFFVGCSRAMRALLVCGARDTPSPFLESLQPLTWARDK